MLRVPNSVTRRDDRSRERPIAPGERRLHQPDTARPKSRHRNLHAKPIFVRVDVDAHTQPPAQGILNGTGLSGLCGAGSGRCR